MIGNCSSAPCILVINNQSVEILCSSESERNRLVVGSGILLSIAKKKWPNGFYVQIKWKHNAFDSHQNNVYKVYYCTVSIDCWETDEKNNKNTLQKNKTDPTESMHKWAKPALFWIINKHYTNVLNARIAITQVSNSYIYILYIYYGQRICKTTYLAPSANPPQSANIDSILLCVASAFHFLFGSTLYFIAVNERLPFSIQYTVAYIAYLPMYMQYACVLVVCVFVLLSRAHLVSVFRHTPAEHNRGMSYRM